LQLKKENELERALALGNLEHSKIQIYFEDDRSKKMVETTVWALTECRFKKELESQLIEF
jgi:hypothetical protein